MHPIVRQLLSIVALATISVSAGADALSDAAARNQTVGHLFAAGDPRAAYIATTRALVENEAALGPNHPEVARSLYQLGVMNQRRGRYREAEQQHEQALLIREATLAAEDVAIADSVMALGAMHRNRGWYASAEPFLQRGLAIRERALGTRHPDVAHSLIELARMYRVQDRFDEAEALARRALDILETELGAEHVTVAEVANELALIFHNQHRYDEAEPFYTRALAVREKVLGPNDILTARSLSNLATLHHNKAEFEQAERYYRHQLEDHGLSATCSCYIGKSGFCHHCEALAFAFLRDNHDFTVMQAKEPSDVHNIEDVEGYLNCQRGKGLTDHSAAGFIHPAPYENKDAGF